MLRWLLGWFVKTFCGLGRWDAWFDYPREETFAVVLLHGVVTAPSEPVALSESAPISLAKSF